MAREEVVGSKHKNLVFKTAGSIRVLIGDKYYNLPFGDDVSNDKEEDKESESSSNSSSFAVIDSISSKEFTSEDNGKWFFTLDGNIYYIKGGKPVKYNATSNGAATSQIVANSNTLVKNLNAQYLNGFSSDDFLKDSDDLRVSNITIDSFSSSDGKVSYSNGKFVAPIEITGFSGRTNIGPAIDILYISELEYGKLLPYENNLLIYLKEINDLLEEKLNYSDLITTVNSNNTILNMDLDDEIIESISEDIFFKKKDSDK